jgi:hypothetical protein
MQPTVSRKIAKHVLIGTSSYPLFSICNPIAERQLSVADYYMPDDGYWPGAAGLWSTTGDSPLRTGPDPKRPLNDVRFRTV